VDDLPLHIKDPRASAFHIIDAGEFNRLGVTGVQAIFGTKHILVHSLNSGKFAFDEAGLLTLSPPNRTFTIQGKCSIL
jgi:hypothetical protein